MKRDPNSDFFRKVVKISQNRSNRRQKPIFTYELHLHGSLWFINRFPIGQKFLIDKQLKFTSITLGISSLPLSPLCSGLKQSKFRTFQDSILVSIAR